MKGIVVYKSKYGATKKYAEWIAQEMGYDLKEVSQIKKNELEFYNVIVYGAGIYAMGIAGLNFLKKNAEIIKTKKVYVFCDGASPFSQEAFIEVKNRNMKDELKDVPLFYFRGGWNMEAMDFLDRNLCKMLRKAVAKKDPKDYEIWEQALMEAGDSTCDWTNIEYIFPLINELKELY